jgi:hypothetical protein
MLGSDYRARIADFGLSRKTELLDLSSKKSCERRIGYDSDLISSEIKDDFVIFERSSLSTDQKSFGLLVWQLFSLGKAPLRNINFDTEKPKFAPKEM